MLAVNYSAARNNLKMYCDEAVDNNEIIIITRKEKRNVALIDQDELNLLLKSRRNEEYLRKIDRSLDQLREGKGQTHGLIEDEDE